MEGEAREREKEKEGRFGPAIGRGVARSGRMEG